MAWKLSKKTTNALFHLRENLPSEVEDMRMAFDEKSVRWQESERGEGIAEWLDSLDRLAEELEDAEDQYME